MRANERRGEGGRGGRGAKLRCMRTGIWLRLRLRLWLWLWLWLEIWPSRGAIRPKEREGCRGFRCGKDGDGTAGQGWPADGNNGDNSGGGTWAGQRETARGSERKRGRGRGRSRAKARRQVGNYQIRSAAGSCGCGGGQRAVASAMGRGNERASERDGWPSTATATNATTMTTQYRPSCPAAQPPSRACKSGTRSAQGPFGVLVSC